MAEQRDILSRLQIVIKRSTPTMRIIAAVCIVLSITTVLVLHSAALELRERTEYLKEQAALEEQKNQELQDSIDKLGSVDSVEDIAKEELGLVDPDSVIVEPEE